MDFLLVGGGFRANGDARRRWNVKDEWLAKGTRLRGVLARRVLASRGRGRTTTLLSPLSPLQSLLLHLTSPCWQLGGVELGRILGFTRCNELRSVFIEQSHIYIFVLTVLTNCFNNFENNRITIIIKNNKIIVTSDYSDKLSIHLRGFFYKRFKIRNFSFLFLFVCFNLVFNINYI